MFELYAFNLFEIFTRLIIAVLYVYAFLKTSKYIFNLDLIAEIKKGNIAVAILTTGMCLVGALIIALFHL